MSLIPDYGGLPWAARRQQKPGENELLIAPYFLPIEAHFRQAGREIIVEAREGRAPVPLATYQKARGIGAAVVEVARSVGRIFACVRPRGRPKVRSHPHGACRSGGIRCPLPFSLGDVGYGQAFPGVVDGRCARVVVERGTTGAGRGLKGRHFSDF